MPALHFIAIRCTNRSFNESATTPSARIKRSLPRQPKPIFSPPKPTRLHVPALLRQCYLLIGNGGFGPGYGVIGAEGGHASDYGTLAEIYAELNHERDSVRRTWKRSLLPFCEWGCNMFSCVDCSDADSRIYLCDELEVSPERYTLAEFFEMWIAGKELLYIDAAPPEGIEFKNPFTGKKAMVLP